MKNLFAKDSRYASLLALTKERIRSAQIKAALQVNSEMILLYWDMAQDIVQAQEAATWGDGFLVQMSKDLQAEFPGIKSFSVRNLQFMKKWFLYWTESKIKTKQLVSQLAKVPWGQNLVIISKSESIHESIYYIQQTIENNWSRSTLNHQIESKLYRRKGRALSNFSAKLPKPQSDLAQELLKDPYQFDFLTIRERHDERELEKALMEQLTKFLLELGEGFAFVGQQYKLSVDEEDFFIDLLFYHIRLHCYVVVELKTVKFKPEFAGKLNFYVSAVDGILKSAEDKPTIGLLICKSKSKTIVEYSLKDIQKPIGVSEYKLTKVLPSEIKSSLPSIEDVEAELDGWLAQKNRKLLGGKK
jgi:predicted nuclease of restriction endonuclease-like (RecB) superfamily